MLNERISHYRLAELLGEGAHGAVYRGVHVHDEDFQVAIKVVRPELVGDPSFLDSLKRECKRIDALDHPAIVRFRDLCIDEGQVAMIMELLQGADLYSRIQQGPMPIDEVVRIATAVLGGLAHAHSKDVLHRDIKPSNIFLCADGRIKVVDFGVARASDSSHATRTGQLVGTLNYIAPERFSETGGTAASDVYAVGLVMWEMLAGRPACPEGELAQKLGWHLGVGAADVRTVRPDCPDWLAEFVALCVSKDTQIRPAQASVAQTRFQSCQANIDPGMSLPQARRDPNPRSAPGTVVLPQQALADARRQSAPGPAGGQSKKTTSVADKRHQQQTSSVFVHAISVVSKLVFDQARAHPLGIVGVLMGIVGALGAFVLFAVQFFVFQPSWNPAAYQQNNEHMIAAEAALIDATLENQQDKAAQWEEIVSQKNDAFYRQLNRQVAALPRAEQAQFATEAQEKFNREMEALATKHFSVANTSNGPAPGSEAYNQKRVEWSELAPQISTRLHAEKMAKMEALEPGDLAGRSRLETEFEQALQAAATKHFFGGDAGAGTPAED